MYGEDFAPAPRQRGRNVNAKEILLEYYKVEPETAVALDWWQKHHLTFPALAPLARKYLTPKPSQIDSERAFSGIKLILSDLRSRLSLQNVHKLSVVRPFLHRMYHTQPPTRSSNNRAADARRVETAATTRRRGLITAFLGVAANPPVPAVGMGAAVPSVNPQAGDDAQAAADLGDGERDSDDDFELDEAETEFREMDDRLVSPLVQAAAATRSSRRGGPVCRLFTVGRGVLQYVARFENLDRDPPPFAALFGPRAYIIKDFVKAGTDNSNWLVTVTDEAKAKYTSSQTLLRHLGEIIQITDEMYK